MNPLRPRRPHQTGEPDAPAEDAFFAAIDPDTDEV